MLHHVSHDYHCCLHHSTLQCFGLSASAHLSYPSQFKIGNGGNECCTKLVTNMRQHNIVLVMLVVLQVHRPRAPLAGLLACWLACWLACLLLAGCASGASASGASLVGWLAGWLACSLEDFVFLYKCIRVCLGIIGAILGPMTGIQ